jgi:hypothetical protein
MYENAIKFVMDFYQVSREIAVELYWDEVEAFMRLSVKLKKDASD